MAGPHYSTAFSRTQRRIRYASHADPAWQKEAGPMELRSIEHFVHIADEGRRTVLKARHSTLMLASLISLAYLSLSERMKAVNCSGVLLTASTPRSAKRFFTSASWSALTVSACSLSTIGRGVPAGISTPHQLIATRPGAWLWHGERSGSSR